EHFPVANLACAGRFDDGGHRALDLLVGRHHFDFDLGQEVHGVFAAAIDFGVAFLPAEPLDLAHGHALDPDFPEGILNFFKFEWLDDGFDFLHTIDVRADVLPVVCWALVERNGRLAMAMPRGPVTIEQSGQWPDSSGGFCANLEIT